MLLAGGALNFGSDGGVRIATWNQGSFCERFFFLKGGGSFSEKTKKGVQKMKIRQIWPIFQTKYKFGHILNKSFEKVIENFDQMLTKKGHLVRDYWNLVVNY